MSIAKIRSERDIHRFEKKYLVWNHGNWTKYDRQLRRAQRHAEKRTWKERAEDASPQAPASHSQA